ncbi:MAG: NYN domain-containing protein [Bacillales bacterium]|jgi:uncharacterized LabA/DUF88 family protein|nr:NYN domain-containing protein [Bacillales bacterium]
MKLAVLIDLDNFKNEISLSKLYIELKSFGEIVLNYGFYCTYNDKNIKKLLQTFGMESIMQPSFDKKENCTDIRITIEALDLLTNRKDIDAYVIGSNDSDFICLSKRIQKSLKKTIIITDNPNIDKNYSNYFDVHLNIYELLNSVEETTIQLAESKDKIFNEKNGEIGEINEDKLSSDKENKIVVGVDNLTANIDCVENKKIRGLLQKIESIMVKVNLKNDMARLDDVCNMLKSTENIKFKPKDYGSSNNRVLEFFQKNLKEYINIKKEDDSYWIKIKAYKEINNECK